MTASIRFYNKYPHKILNLSGIKATPELVHGCQWLQRYNADAVHELWDFSRATIITRADLETRARAITELATSVGISTIWIRPIKTAPFLFGVLEKELHNAGFSVAYPADDDKGWWVSPPTLYRVRAGWIGEVGPIPYKEVQQYQVRHQAMFGDMNDLEITAV